MTFLEDLTPNSGLLPHRIGDEATCLTWPPRRSHTQLIDFLQHELAISATSIAMALRHREQDPGPLPMILWQYGFVSLEQLEQIFDWLEG